MRVAVSSVFPCPLARIWQEVQTTRLLNYVAAPLVRFQPVDPPAWPERWSEGHYRVGMTLFGFLPWGQQWIVASVTRLDTTPGQQHYELRDNGYSSLISRWDHRITIRETADGMTHYSDTVDIRAGWLTLFVWAFAQVFYRHRQNRWRQLVASNFAYPPEFRGP